jgi:DNA-directed RNA polymerase subunit RPC12/RpoP
MRTIKIKCNVCAKNYQVNSVHAGKKVKCKNCSNQILIPKEMTESQTLIQEGSLEDFNEISRGDIIFWTLTGVSISTSASLLARLIFLVAE